MSFSMSAQLLQHTAKKPQKPKQKEAKTSKIEETTREPRKTGS